MSLRLYQTNTVLGNVPSENLILDQVYLDTILAEFDAYYGFDDFDWTPPDPPDLPHLTLWRRTRALVGRRMAKLILRSNRTPDLLSDYALPLAETWSLEGGR